MVLIIFKICSGWKASIFFFKLHYLYTVRIEATVIRYWLVTLVLRMLISFTVCLSLLENSLPLIGHDERKQDSKYLPLKCKDNINYLILKFVESLYVTKHGVRGSFLAEMKWLWCHCANTSPTTTIMSDQET